MDSVDQTNIDERHLRVGDCQLHVRTAGVAGHLPTIVLEAGGGSILPAWGPLEQALAPHAQVLSYERAGIGESSGPVGSVQASAVSQRLETLLKTAGIRTPGLLAEIGRASGRARVLQEW